MRALMLPLSALALALVAAPGPVLAASESDNAAMKEHFGEIDAAGDGAITRDEWTSREVMLESPPNFFVINMDSDLTEDDKITKEEWDNFFASQ